MVCHLIYRIYHAFHAFLHTERHISVSVAALFYMSSVGRLAGHTPPNKFPILWWVKAGFISEQSCTSPIAYQC